MKQSNKYRKLSDFKKATEGMTFIEGTFYTRELVKSIIESKEELAEYDKDFFEKIGYTRDGKEKYAWNNFNVIPFSINLNGILAIKDFSIKLNSYLYLPVGLKLISAILLGKKVDPKIKVNDRVSAKLMIYELKRFFNKYSVVGADISQQELGRRIYNTIENVYKEKYIISLIKNFSESDYNKL